VRNSENIEKSINLLNFINQNQCSDFEKYALISLIDLKQYKDVNLLAKILYLDDFENCEYIMEMLTFTKQFEILMKFVTDLKSLNIRNEKLIPKYEKILEKLFNLLLIENNLPNILLKFQFEKYENNKLCEFLKIKSENNEKMTEILLLFYVSNKEYENAKNLYKKSLDSNIKFVFFYTRKIKISLMK